MAAPNHTDTEIQSLSEKFEKALNIHINIQNYSGPSNSKNFQGEVQKAISLLEEATLMVNNLDLFSTNEEFEEISTADIKYLLLPALLGNLTSKLASNDRLQLIEASEVYFKDYLRRLNSYGVSNVPLSINPSEEEDSGGATSDVVATSADPLESLEATARKRNIKIKRYTEQKQLEETQRVLRKRMDEGSVDDETVREYYSVLLRSWVNSALEELQSINMEKPILRHMAQLKAEGKEFKKVVPQSKPLKPVIIARNAMQKRVIGVGYPSIPVYTVDQFYEQKYGEHAPHKDTSSMPGLSLQKMAEDPEEDARELEQEEAEKEKNVERDDPVTLIRERNWDDWKDEHRRGWGNRHNMG